MLHLLTAGTRPASIWYDGAEVRIDVHDLWMARKSRHFLSIMQRTHPDRIRNRNNQLITGTTFRLASSQLLNFRMREARWYAKRGLTLPRVSLRGLPRVIA